MAEKTSNKSRLKKVNWVQTPDLKDYSKAPYFIEKNEKANDFLLKHGLPKDVQKKIQK